MFKSYLLILLPLFVLLGCNSVKQKSLSVSPNLIMPGEQDVYLKDFGSIKAGEVARHSFVLRNDSQEVLNIKDITASCGCVVSEVKNRILKPGESSLVGVRFNSKGYSGAVQQFVYVNTDNPNNSLIRFIIKANVTK